jgi:hypothetical protein
MKKYLFGMIAIALAVGFSAFTTVKSKPTTTLYRFVFNGSPTGSNLETKNTTGTDYYSNWVLEGTESTLTECSPAQEKACRVAVTENYTEVISSVRRLLAEDPDGGSPKLAFPMSVEDGLFANPIQYKIVSLDIDQDDVREIRNGSVQ